MDIADKSDNAIIRPGKSPKWRIVDSECFRASEIIEVAKSKHAFGESIELVEHGSADCCGALFASDLDGGIRARPFWLLEYFFARDRAEARVFEYDRWLKQFFCRRIEELQMRRK